MHHDTSRSPRIALTSSASVGDRPHAIATVAVGSPLGDLDLVRGTCWDMILLHVRPVNIRKVMYINLARRTDRRAMILSELVTLEIAPESNTRIDAIDDNIAGGVLRNVVLGRISSHWGRPFAVTSWQYSSLKAISK